MPRWLEALLTLVLFTAVMAALGWVLKATVPEAVDWLDQQITSAGTLVLFIVIWIPMAIYGYWPRDASGNMRRLRSPWE